MSLAAPAPQARIPRLDALALTILAIARIRIDMLAEAAVLPQRMADVARHPWLGRLLSPQSYDLLAQQGLMDPIGLLLVVGVIGCLLAYLLVDELARGERARDRAKLMLIWAIVVLAVFAPALKLTLLRHENGPASYSHDGGVIQTEETIQYLLAGKNPYVEDYVNTPMAAWGISEFRTALYHYPYLPWTFIFSAPFERLASAALGWYDQRFVYLLLFALTLLLLPKLVRDPQRRLLLVMVIGLNPIMGSDLIYGMNDSFVLAWVVLSLALWLAGKRRGGGRGWQLASAAAFGLACASKPTAWFLLPFYAVLVTGGSETSWSSPRVWLAAALRDLWPAVAVPLLLIGPYAIWNFGALYDDVWRWANGTSETAYQIWGWGRSNLVLVLGWVKDRFAYWPFWVPQLLLGAPLLWLLLRRQWHANSVGRALWGYGLFLLVFFFVSRFLNENYLGYITAFLALGALADPEIETAAPPSTNPVNAAA